MFGTARGRDIGQERSSGGSNGPLGSREYCFSHKACPIPPFVMACAVVQVGVVSATGPAEMDGS